VVLRHLDRSNELDQSDEPGQSGRSGRSGRPDPAAPTGDRQPVRLLLYAFPDG
jgi:hypothetical protein